MKRDVYGLTSELPSLENLRAFTRESNWVKGLSFCEQNFKNELYDLLISEGSLTTFLKELSLGSFEVEVIWQGEAKINKNEKTLLLRGENLVSTIIREVFLKIHGVPVVYARSAIPNAEYIDDGNEIVNLGNMPLGHLLFKHGEADRHGREFCSSEMLVARRTPYAYHGEVILVSEVFLPSIHSFL